MKHINRWICGFIFLILCVLTVIFLYSFTTHENPVRYVQWQSSSFIDKDGAVHPFEMEEHGNAPETAEGTYFSFSAMLEQVEPGDYFLFEISGAEITLSLEEEELYRSSSIQPVGTVNMGQVHIPLPQNAQGRQINMTYRPLSGENTLFPPLLRLTSDIAAEADTMAYANLYGIPAGIFGVIFLVLCGIFLVGLSYGKKDWSLLVLVLAAAGLTVYEITVSCGYAFLSDGVRTVLTWHGIRLMIPLAILAYLLLKRKRAFWRHLGIISLWSAAGLLVLYLISLLRGSYLSRYLNDSIVALFQHGVYDGLAHWLTFYLVIACTGIAVAGHLRSIAQMQSEAQTLKMKNELVLDSYHAIECSVQQTASMRHELKKHITAMNLMYQQKKLEELGHYLEKLDTQQTQLSQTQFTDNFMINAILQNAAAEAAEIGVRFEAHAVTPQELFIDEGDLCSFLMNMLDNAMEACQLIPAQNARFIRFRIELKNGFLAISCINSYIGRTVKDDNGRLKTTKPDQTIHGFGLRQMSAIAEKYHSIVDISYTNDVFTVQTALQLKEKS